MRTRQQAKDKIGLEKAKVSLTKKAKYKREKEIFTGFLFEMSCFILTGGLFALGPWFSFFYPLSFFTFILSIYLAFDVGKKIETNARVNFIVENKINERIK